MSGVKMSMGELGNLAYAELDDAVYVGAQKEWVLVEEYIDGATKQWARKYSAVNDDSQCRQLYLAYIAKNIEVNLDGQVAKYMAKRRGGK